MMGQTAFSFGSGPLSQRLAGAGARVFVVIAAHIALIIGLAQLHPQMHQPIAPVFVSLITPPQLESEPSPPAQTPDIAKPVPKPLVRAPLAAAAVKSREPEPRAESTPATTSTEAAITVAPSMASGVESAPQTGAAASLVPSKPKPPAPVIAPRFDVAYLNNPRPEYPRMARRLGEHGRVTLHVYVNAAGLAEKVDIRTSSGYPRLDEAARDAVRNWKFIPARQGDESIGAWVLVPISFVLEG
jgi:protein TonB